MQSIPLSNDTAARKIGNIAEDVQHQLFRKLGDKLFSIHLDETTDSKFYINKIFYIIHLIYLY